MVWISCRGYSDVTRKRLTGYPGTIASAAVQGPNSCWNQYDAEVHMYEDRRFKLSRRDFVSLLAASSGAASLFSHRLNAQEADSRATKLVNDNMAVDMHNHVSIRVLSEG